MKLDKKDKKIIAVGIIFATIAGIFVEKALDIVIILEIMYFIHKYLYNGQNYQNLDDYDIVYINKEKYYEGLKRMVVILDIYLIIRMIILLLINIHDFLIFDVLILISIIRIYGEYLGRKYIKSINGEDVVRKRIFINNKILTATVLVIFALYSFTYISNLTINENEISSSKYSFSITYDKKDNKIVELKSKDDFYQRGEYREKNAPYMEKYIQDGKIFISMSIIKDYCFITTLFMFALVFTQINFKDRRKTSVAVDIFIILSLLFTSIWSINIYDLQYDICSYFAQYIGSL